MIIKPKLFSDSLGIPAVWTLVLIVIGGKIAGIFFPIMMFVLCGFEHSVANMYYISAGLFQTALNGGGADGALNVGNYLGANLLPVTIGNIIGGALFVGVIYWVVYLKKKK